MGPSARALKQDSAASLTFERLLVPLDGSAQAEEALTVAATLSRRHESGLLLCTVLGPPPGAPALAETGEESARRYLAETVRAAQDRGIRAWGIVQTGAVPESLLAVAAEQGASLIIWSAQVWRTPESGRLDPTAERLLRLSPIPILTTTPPPAPPAGNPLDAPERSLRTMLVALGTGGESAALTHGSLRFAETFRVELVVLLEVVPPGRSGREEAELRVEAEERLRELERPFQESQIPTLSRVASGEPAASILSVATDLNVDVIGVDGGTAVRGLIGKSSVPVLSFPAP